MIKYFFDGNQVTLLEDDSSLFIIIDIRIKLNKYSGTLLDNKVQFFDVNIPFKYGNILKKGICKINNELFVCYTIAKLEGNINEYSENKIKEVYSEVVEVLNKVT
ncbi:hypothetical protein [Acidianus sp. HS-5]|uniref:hypothetical protein n=1 Tax=Acidianus sp. HS-5 TaxID=2886040 RepID=UPI001F1BFDD9|nr:hypothetical protein [Acidianus sp. HS-5]BDC19864.1 hypothetical protein HS5_27540 [Acidianus sp. HS-5]